MPERIILPNEDFDENGPLMCMACNGTGTVHGCCDDLCRGRGWDEHGADCKCPRFCSVCEGGGYLGGEGEE